MFSWESDDQFWKGFRIIIFLYTLINEWRVEAFALYLFSKNFDIIFNPIVSKLAWDNDEKYVLIVSKSKVFTPLFVFEVIKEEFWLRLEIKFVIDSVVITPLKQKKVNKIDAYYIK